ncbi:uncharacterized protein CIMG_01171 [Coccidioides immitis RS]|uniref:Pheromone-regulated membrane protein 6 n=1 Tax=Coccidioides immitis (strain RS) TaxID=246410 RepID=J3KIL6_COCIM|nr:uncharacterized protein CIMG_01171 [Coccidioides immitis RS]EAS35817.3 hypothetical protein CIMG_01171 [Coccidioides immitis RS]
MGCCGDRHRDDDLIHVKAEQKWDYITLTDFRSTSCFTFLSYCILYLTIIKSFAVYGVDTFTAVNLLAFSRWASQIKPKIPFGISKWIFSGCIILSFVLLAYRWIRAIRVIKSGGVAQSYLDPIAVRVQSTRMGSEGQGFRRFLVFAELTKSKKGADYVALFTYFNFESWLRVIFAEGPRQAINGFTLYSVMELRLIPIGENAPSDGTPAVVQFFNNVEALAEKDKLQATILFAMLFTFVIWVLSILSLALSLIMYLLFLWHHIPSEDGSLTAYCRRKINTRLERIVKRKVDRALAKGLALQDRKRTDLETGVETIKQQPTLPTFDYASSNLSSVPPMPGLSRQTTATTLPPYSRAPPSGSGGQFGMDRQPTLPDMKWENPPLPTSTPGPGTRTSDDTASLVNNAGGFGYTAPPSEALSSPTERYGTPFSASMSDVSLPGGRARRTPAPSIAPFVDPYGRAPPSLPTPRLPTPRTQSPAPREGYSFARPPPPATTVPERSVTAPIPSVTPSPSSYRNFTRPWPAPTQVSGKSSMSQYSNALPSPRRVGTAPPSQDSLPYNPGPRF